MPHGSTRRRKQHEQEKLMRKARKQLKKNQRTRVRDRHWTRYPMEAYEDLEFPTEERIVARGERERRTAALAAITEQLTGDETTPDDPSAEWQKGTVTAVSSGLCRVDAQGTGFICSVRGSLTAYNSGYTNVVAVGDEVLFSAVDSDRGIIEKVQPRRTSLSRPDVFHPHLRQVVAANVDRLLIVCSLEHPLIWFELVDRYLIAAAHNGLEPIICLNKIDLATSEEEYRRPMQPYLALDYEVLFTSATTGQGIDELRATLKDSRTVLAGLSGVGKSSLLNAVQLDLRLKTGLVSDRHHEGRHTTVQASLLPLAIGGTVVDTPGIREFGLWDVAPEEVAGYFPEIASLSGHCRFSGCSHVHEPGCAVRAAVDERKIAASRYDSYMKIRVSR